MCIEFIAFYISFASLIVRPTNVISGLLRTVIGYFIITGRCKRVIFTSGKFVPFIVWESVSVRILRNQYNAVLTGRDSLNAAVMALDVASVNLNTATAKRAVGEITELEYQNVLNSYISAKNSVETDKLQLLLAMEAYDWNVKGLTTSN